MIRSAALGVIVVFCWSTGPTAAAIPSPGTNNLLKGISCATASSCLAVGQSQNTAGGYLNPALHFNWKQWAQVKTPQPGGNLSGALSDLYGISCPATSDCWAVGAYGQGAPRQLALRWNGKRWLSAKVPQPGGRGSGAVNELDSVTCTSRRDCWAVGVSTGKSGAFLNQTLHWNGRKWSHAKTPQRGGASGSNLLSISCASAADCVAVGEANASGGASLDQALRFNGKKWTHVKTPQPGGTAIGNLTEPMGTWCASASACRAVGQVSSGSALLNLALGFNGKKWTDN